MDNILVSIVLPTYNSWPYIKDCLDSITRQSFSNWELLIFDDGSKDPSLLYTLDYLKKEPRAKLFLRNQSYISNLNEGLEIAKGKYIARMDADDIMTPNRLEKQVEYLEAHNYVDLISSTAVIIDRDNTINDYYAPFIVGNKLRPMDMAAMNHIIHPSVMVKKSIIDKYKLRYNPSYLYAEDYELWVHMLEKNLWLQVNNDYSIYYRKHKNSMSITHQERINEIRDDILNRLKSMF